jgi:secondary thiamine-phosphate synthase enzyme
MIRSKQLAIDSEGHFDVVNITNPVREFVNSTGVKQGQLLIFYKHTTGAIWIAEHEPGIIADLKAMFDRTIPQTHSYFHHLRAVDFNGHAHIRSALMNVSVTIPILDGELALGTYQEILVVDDQTDPASRHVVLQVVGE